MKREARRLRSTRNFQHILSGFFFQYGLYTLTIHDY